MSGDKGEGGTLTRSLFPLPSSLFPWYHPIVTLIRNLLHRSRPEPETQGPLYGPVKDAIVSVQAYARSHGGEIELVGVNDSGDVTIRLRGACRGCPMSALTLKHGIEEQLRESVPGVGKIDQV